LALTDWETIFTGSGIGRSDSRHRPLDQPADYDGDLGVSPQPAPTGPAGGGGVRQIPAEELDRPLPDQPDHPFIDASTT
jgi:hypothetical protein